jgi:hypothetical protein
VTRVCSIARAAARGVAEQDLVEAGTAYLVGVGKALVPGLREVQRDGCIVDGRIELDPVLAHEDRLHLVAHAQGVEQRQVERQQRLADVEAQVARLLEQHHIAASPRQQRREGGSGRAAADHQHVAGIATGAG